MKTTTMFGLSFTVVAMILFYLCSSIIPGFPFFPENVLTTTNEVDTVHLKSGNYTVLYFIKGGQNLSVSRQDVGLVEIDLVKPIGSNALIKVFPSNYYFDEAPGKYGIRGHSVVSFYLPVDQAVTVKSHFKKFGYDGLIVRTGFQKLLICMAVYGVFASIFSIGLTWLVKYRRMPLIR